MGIKLPLALLLLSSLYASADDKGLPPVAWFSAHGFGAENAVWSFAQDDRGIIYAGTEAGIVEYDGVSWRSIATPHNRVVRALAKGPGGRIFVGELGDFGYLQPDPSGEMKFVSLLEFVPKEDRNFGQIFRSYVTPQGVYFQARERLFRLIPQGQGWRARVWKPVTSFRHAFYVYGTIYVSDPSGGLQRLNGDKLETLPLPGLSQSTDAGVAAMLPYSPPPGAEPMIASTSRPILLATRGGRLYLLDDAGLRPFAVESAPASRGLKLNYAAVALNDGAFGFCTTGGFLILERDGRTRQFLDDSAGIPSADGPKNALVDHSGSVWLALRRGIAKVEVSSPFSEFGQAAGLSAMVLSMARYQGDLYAGSAAGLLSLDSATGRFHTIPGTQNWTVSNLLVSDDRLLVCAGIDGIFEFDGKTMNPVVRVSNGNDYHWMLRSPQNANRIWLGGRDGLGSMRRDSSGRWIDEGITVKIQEVDRVDEMPSGVLWLSTINGVHRARLDGDSLHNPSVEKFGGAQGLPKNRETSVFALAGQGIFAAMDKIAGIRKFDPATGRFFEWKEFGPIPSGPIYMPLTDRRGNIWLDTNPIPTLLVRQSDGKLKADENRTRPLRRLGDESSLSAWFLDTDGSLWLAESEPLRILRFDPARVKADPPFSTILRRVTKGDKEKQLLYDGAGTQRSVPEILFKNNTFRFEYAAASFDDPQKNQFQTKLDGFDPDWSDWSTETRRDYTNLPPGEYHFRVRSRNVLGDTGAEATYSLKILPLGIGPGGLTRCTPCFSAPLFLPAFI